MKHTQYETIYIFYDIRLLRIKLSSHRLAIIDALNGFLLCHLCSPPLHTDIFWMLSLYKHNSRI